MVGHHVVDVLDKYDIGIHRIQIANECPVPSRTEYKLSVGIAKRFILHIHGYRVGAGLLRAERHRIMHPERFLVGRRRFLD